MKGKIFKRIFNLLKTALVFLVSATVLYFFAALILSFLKTHLPDLNCATDKKIYITTNGIHLDIVMPVENIEPEFLSKLEVLPGTKYVSFGWGDKEFYINTPEWKDLTFKTAFKALFLKSEAAMHVTCYRGFGADWNPMQLCGQQINRLNSYIENSFKKSAEGKLRKIAVPGYFENDAFYEATGSFSLFKTCNVWVNRALKKAGIQTSVWSPFDIGVLYHLPE